MIFNGAVKREIKNKAAHWHCTVCDRQGKPIPLRPGSIQETLAQVSRLGEAHYNRAHKEVTVGV